MSNIPDRFRDREPGWYSARRYLKPEVALNYADCEEGLTVLCYYKGTHALCVPPWNDCLEDLDLAYLGGFFPNCERVRIPDHVTEDAGCWVS